METYEYGINVILFNCVSFIMLVLLNLCIGNNIYLICFILMFTPLRRHSGGIHANTHIKCLIMTACIYGCYVVLTMKIAEISLLKQLLLIVVADFFIINLGPIIMDANRLSKKQEMINRIQLTILTILITVICFAMNRNMHEVSNCGISVLILIAILLICTKGVKLYEKYNNSKISKAH